ncbi:MAG: hypothetical protein NT049_03510 [Planctomycetota bacterium]|nr:hypothetical protein [Planctomycetota bacterium]
MKSVIHGVLALVVVLGFAGMALAEDAVPWKAGDPPKADAPAATGAPAAGETPALSADAKTEKAAAAVKAILAKIEAAQKVGTDEAAKPADKQNAKKISGSKEIVARLYLTASQTAKMQSSSFAADQKQPFLDQYDKPNREKAIAGFLELANDSLLKKDYNNAESLAKQVLKIDPKNAEAEALLKKIAEDKAADAKTAAKGGSGGSSDKNTTTVDPRLDPANTKNLTNPTKTDYSKSDGKGGTRRF